MPASIQVGGQTGDWFYQTNRGLYTEDGIVYMIGSAVAGVNGTTFAYPGSDYLIVGIPGDLVPDDDTSVQVMIDPLNSSEHFATGGWLAATVHPDGTITLDDGNPTPAIPDNPGTYDYALISLLLSSIAWPVGEGVPISTPSTTYAAGPLVEGGDGWTDINGKYVTRATRFHFSGKIQAGPLANENAPVVIPAESCPASLGTVDEEFHWTAVCTKDGHAFFIDPRDDIHAHPLFVLGMAGGRDDSFYATTGDGKGHGTEVTLDFTPNTSDIGVAYTGYKGSPLNPLSTGAEWRGSAYSATVNFNTSDLIVTEDLIELPPLGGDFPSMHSIISGDGQLAFIMAVSSTGLAYYKLVFTYNSPNNKVYGWFIHEICGDTDERELITVVDITELVRSGGDVSYNFTVQFSTDPSDVGVTETDHGPLVPGYDYYRILDDIGLDRTFGHEKGSVTQSATGGPDLGFPFPPAGGKGDMGIHLPPGTSAEVFSKSISGIGTFPAIPEGTIIDLGGAGWPL